MNRTGWRTPYRRRLTQAAAVAALLTLPVLGPVAVSGADPGDPACTQVPAGEQCDPTRPTVPGDPGCLQPEWQADLITRQICQQGPFAVNDRGMPCDLFSGPGCPGWFPPAPVDTPEPLPPPVDTPEPLPAPVDTPEPAPAPIDMPTPDLSSPAGTAATLP